MDLFPADLLWTFFAAALTSYRRDSVLRPFPVDYVSCDGEKDFDALTAILKQCPALHVVNKEFEGKVTQLIKLMRWILNPKYFTLKQLRCEKFEEIYNSAAGADHDFRKVPKPNYIFEVLPSPSRDEKFKSLQSDSGLLYGFHGSKVENFYSILNNGLRNNLNKVSLYGEGIYLSSDLSIAMNYSPTGQGWNHSLFGESLSCVAVCEMIDHPDVKCTLKCKSDRTDGSIAKDMPLEGSVREDNATCFTSARGSCSKISERSRIRGSEGGKIPEKYFVVRNDDLVRVKYLFVYAPLSRRVEAVDGSQTAKTSFFRRHRFFFTMFIYVFVLILASICNSKVFKEWWRKKRD